MQDGTFGDHPAWGLIINALDAYLNRSLELKVVLGIVVADILNHLVNTSHFTGWDFTILHIATYQVAEGTTEVLMTGIAQE